MYSPTIKAKHCILHTQIMHTAISKQRSIHSGTINQPAAYWSMKVHDENATL